MNEVFIALLSVSVGFLLGILGQFASAKIKERKDRKEFEGFNEMITTEYVEPYRKLSEGYFNEDASVSNGEVTAYLSKSITSLTYLKTEEISFLKTDNQFKMIRLIEFTKSYFRESQRILNEYSFQSPLPGPKDSDKEMHREKIDKLEEEYKNKKEKYLNLKAEKLSAVK